MWGTLLNDLVGPGFSKVAVETDQELREGATKDTSPPGQGGAVLGRGVSTPTSRLRTLTAGGKPKADGGAGQAGRPQTFTSHGKSLSPPTREGRLAFPLPSQSGRHFRGLAG